MIASGHTNFNHHKIKTLRHFSRYPLENIHPANILYIKTVLAVRIMTPLMLIPPVSDRISVSQKVYNELISCGFPSPAEGSEDAPLDLHAYCVKRPASTFFIRCDGLSMVDEGIAPRDLLVVDCSVTPTHGAIVVARVDGEFTVKRLQLRPTVALIPMNPAFSVIELAPDALDILGVVTFSVRDHLHVSA